MKKFGLLFTILFSSIFCFSQNKNLEIKKVEINYDEGCKGCIDIYFSFRDVVSSDAVEIENQIQFNRDFKISESINDDIDKVLNISPDSFSKFDPEEVTVNNTTEKVFKLDVTIFLALDLSGTMKPSMLESAKEAIKKLFLNENVADGQVYLYTFHDNVSDVQLITSTNYNEVLNRIESTSGKNYEVDPSVYGNLNDYYSRTSRSVRRSYGNVIKTYDTNLHGAIVEKVRELEQLTQKESMDANLKNTEKILVVLTDGKNDTGDIPDYFFGIKERHSASEVIELVKASDVTVNTVGLGDDVDAGFLNEVALANKKGDYYYADIPEDLGNIYKTIGDKVLPDYKVTVLTEDCTFKGNTREYTIKYDKFRDSAQAEETFTCRLGDINHFQSNCKGQDIYKSDTVTNKLYSLLWGAGFVFALFVILALIFPFLRKLMFRSKYVTKYIQELDEERICPYCADEFKTKERIVIKCDHIMHHECWKENNNKCPDHPNLCSTGIEENYNFKDFLKGRKGSEIAIWAFFGALGGLFSYIPIPEKADEGSSLVKPLISILHSGADEVTVNMLSIGAKHGLILGFFLTLMFSLAENKKGLNISTIGLSIVRAIIGGVFGLITYYLGTYLGDALNINYFSQMIPMIFFGIAIGMALSFKSSVTIRNGIIGGLIASFIAANIYYVLFTISGGGFGFDMIVLKFILFGAILGGIISIVLNALESFYLEYLSGKSIGKRVPISKWMMEGLEVYIGASRGCHVVVNNVEGVANQHAIMKYNKESQESHIMSVKGNEVYVNSRAIPSNLQYRIRNNDIIVIGDNQQAKFKYAEKR